MGNANRAGLHDLQYPIGKFQPPHEIDPQQRADCLLSLEQLPARLRAAVADLSPAQLSATYRPGGWTITQLVHHIADSHMNAYLRFRLALTETAPTIKPYREADWAELEDARSAPVELSLVLLEALHRRWILLARSTRNEDFSRCYLHPELGETSLHHVLCLYAWHGEHHLAHIRSIAR